MGNASKIEWMSCIPNGKVDLVFGIDASDDENYRADSKSGKGS